MEVITNILYWLTTGLLVPVTVFLIFFFIRGLMLIGGFYGVYLNRNKVNTRINESIDTMNIDELLESINEIKIENNPLLEYLNRIKTHAQTPPMLEKILGDYEVYSDKELGKSRLLVKIGPMLGLMGTLIPMGPALVGLAVGDIASMANNMQVAFATTVVGILIGAIGLVTLQVKQRWVADDMNILEYVAESIKNKNDEKETTITE